MTRSTEMTMDPVPYEIREEDIDEVLEAYAPATGWTDEQRGAAHDHVMEHVMDIGDVVRTAPEREPTSLDTRTSAVAEPVNARPGHAAPARREYALAAIEDLLLAEGLLDARPDEARVFPVTGDR